MKSTSSATFCYKHPDRETVLRCNRCDNYICPSCAVLTPTGYRCKDCIREQKKVYDTAKVQDYFLAFMVAAVLSYLGSLIAQYIGFFLFYLTLIVAPGAGFVIAEVVRRVVGRRRSTALFRVATLAVVLGGLPVILDDLLYLILYRDPSYLFGLLWPGIYIVLAAGATYASLSGIRFR
jgi:hypothetical protein